MKKADVDVGPRLARRSGRSARTLERCGRVGPGCACSFGRSRFEAPERSNLGVNSAHLGRSSHRQTSPRVGEECPCLAAFEHVTRPGPRRFEREGDDVTCSRCTRWRRKGCGRSASPRSSGPRSAAAARRQPLQAPARLVRQGRELPAPPVAADHADQAGRRLHGLRRHPSAPQPDPRQGRHRAPISITGYIVDSNIPRAPDCAVHKTGKKDPDNCNPEVPSFWIADDKGNTKGPKVRVVGWARNFAVIYDAMVAYKKVKPGDQPKEPVTDDMLNVPVPFPLPRSAPRSRSRAPTTCQDRRLRHGQRADRRRYGPPEDATSSSRLPSPRSSRRAIRNELRKSARDEGLSRGAFVPARARVSRGLRLVTASLCLKCSRTFPRQ